MAERPAWLDQRPPDIKGPAGRAWRWRIDGSGAPQAATTLGQWLIHAPGSHPFWTWYVLMGITLRDAPGLPPAHRHFPDAEYEVMVVALNPERPVPEPDGDVDGGLPYLTPIDQVHQFGAVPGGDAKAIEILEMFARGVCDGHLVPDQDHRAAWSRTVAATVKHIQEGRH